jgi:glutathione S-transferase
VRRGRRGGWGWRPGAGEEASVLKVWGRINSINVQKVLWALDELQLPYERIDAGMAFGVVNEASYKKMNPNARVPTIDEDGFVLWESNAIVRYLATKHGSGGLCPTDLRARADCERWMDWASIHLNPAMGPAFLGLVRTPPDQRNMPQIAASAAATAEQFQILEQSLGDRHYVSGQGFTMGDIIVGVNVYRWYALDVTRPHLPRLEAYHARLQQRPAFRKHVMRPLS